MNDNHDWGKPERKRNPLGVIVVLVVLAALGAAFALQA